MDEIVITDTVGDTTIVKLSYRGKVWLIVNDQTAGGATTAEAMFTPDQARKLRKALKRAIKASEAHNV